jgi:choline dehydrogenase-like flavoprotein
LTGPRPFFRRSENFHPPTATHQEQYQSSYISEFNGTGGPLHTSHVKQYGPAHQYWHKTLNCLDILSSRDSLAGVNMGAWDMVCTIDPDRQERSYSASAYYSPVAQRPNLHLLTNATAMVILFDSGIDTMTATGASVRCDGLVANVHAKKEVILCAGSVQSPQLLELSGIGNREILEAAGVQVKFHNANVGENLQDHMSKAGISVLLSLANAYSDCHDL